MKNKYCNSLTSYSRLLTREVRIGNIPLGGKNPIRIQSMTTTNTMNTIATVEQTIRMVNSGCEYVRITAPSIKEAQNLKNIKDELKKRGYNTPLIADIHFTPNAAEVAARIVEKVRVNPGNYADKKKFNFTEYSDGEYLAELERIREKFIPLVKVCKEYGTAMRIGTNHGSLSDRIMSRYGDTPIGMVESALEFVRICEDENFNDIVLSMKASNPQVMIQAYRLLANSMIKNGTIYPLHIGVTEAGEGVDGRTKSAVGIGTLLEDGLGDTVRVSLTEEPEFEAPVAISLVNRYGERKNHKPIPELNSYNHNPFEYNRRESVQVSNIGGGEVTKVVADLSTGPVLSHEELQCIGYKYDAILDKWNIKDEAADIIYLGDNSPDINLPQNIKVIVNYNTWLKLNDQTSAFPLFGYNEYINSKDKSFVLNFVAITLDDILRTNFSETLNGNRVVLVLSTDNEHTAAELRRAMFELRSLNIDLPVIFRLKYQPENDEDLLLKTSTDFGSLLIDGFGDGVWAVNNNNNVADLKFTNKTLFGILQASRVRITRTEYIACPSCGRTLFDLVEVTNKIKTRTEHLKGVKIGIMGCIVNGPGEMADADYGYVGSGNGKITLYRGKDIVEKSIDENLAVDRLIQLIKEDGNWVEKI